VDIAHLSQFDYAALGHLHRAQTCKTEERGGIVRYSGSPIAYSVSEADDEKSVTVVTLCEKGNCTVDVRPLTPHRTIVRLRGTYDDVMALEFYRDTDYKDAFVQMTLTDEADVPDALYRLRTVYPYLLRLEYDNTRTRADQTMELLPDAADMDPETLFSAFYRMQNGTEMEEDMAAYLHQMIACLWREEENR
jgi:exonuclease SbcD